MIERLIDFSIRRRWLVLVAGLAVAALGLWNYGRLPIDAVPDVTNVQVQINTAAPGFSPLETEQRITFPVETAMAGLPHLDFTRSLSRYGLSQVTVIFKDGTDIYFARQLISERITQIKDRLPPGVTVEMGPISTALGEIYMWSVEAKEGAKNEQGQPYTSTDLRTVQEWIIKPQLRNVPGVIEINSIGGYEKQYDVTPRPERLVSYGLSFRDVMDALMLMGENSRAVADRVDMKMKEVNRSLPPGVTARTLYTRTKLVDATIDTVKKNLFEGALLVMAILFALLGNWRAALITTFVIP